MKLRYTGLLMITAGLLISSCKKSTQIFPNPYTGAKSPLGISDDAQQIPVPASGKTGDEITIQATGLLPYYGKGLEFDFNGQKAEITQVTSTYIKVKVPANSSSGITTFVVNGQVVFGPRFTVLGKVNLDPTYANTIGTDLSVVSAFPVPNSSGQLILMGNFTNYNAQGNVRKINRIARVFADGTFDRTFLSGAGANSTVNDLAQVGPYYYIVGDFTAYAQQSGNVSRIAKIQTNGLIDTTQVTTYLLKTKYVPTFNGGLTGGTVRNIYPVGTNKMIVVGNFQYYTTRNYSANTYDAKDSTIVDSTIAKQVVRLNDDGSLDRTWRFNPTAPGYKVYAPGASLDAANGPLTGSVYNPADKSLLLYGRFTTFDGKPANGILRLNTSDGSVDNTFTNSGPDQLAISSISYNATLNKYLVAGGFNTFNGKPAQYLVRLNYDGSVDATFTPKTFDGGVPTFVKLLDDGLAVVGGDFRTYGGVIRNGFFVIDSTGALIDGYNNTGNVNGTISNVYETRTGDNKRALLIMGSFTLFDNVQKNNIVRVTFE